MGSGGEKAREELSLRLCDVLLKYLEINFILISGDVRWNAIRSGMDREMIVIDFGGGEK